ncbi:MAG: tol-pal system protein YbgF [Methyloceanibacter sp.]
MIALLTSRCARSHPLRAVAAAGLLACLLASPVYAQQAAPAPAAQPKAPSGDSTSSRIGRLEEQFADLQVMVGTLESLLRANPNAGSQAGSSAPPSVSRGDDGGFGDAGPRIQALETQIQALTNQMEQMAQQLSAMQAQLSCAPQSLPPLPQNGDVPGRQGQAPAQSPTALASATDAIAPTSFDTTTTPNGASQPPENRDADAWPESLSPLPSDLGSGSGGHDQPQSLTAALPANDAKALYEQGYGSVMQRDYVAAEPVFREFLATYPSDRLAGNAQYWLGESYFMRGQFKDAADTFLKGYQTYKSNQMAPDTLLKLGMSLAALGQKDAACSTFNELKTKYPSARDHIRELAANERTKAGC